MFKDFHIKNFRCFKDTKIEGFERVNLIGGKNNAGKTALLEALFLFISPEPESILFLKKIRRELLSSIQKNPEQTWANFFFNNQKDSVIELKLSDQINYYDDELLDIVRTVKLTSQDSIKPNFDNIDLKNLDENLTGSSKYILSALKINSTINDDYFEYEKDYTLIANPLGEIEISSSSISEPIRDKSGQHLPKYKNSNIVNLVRKSLNKTPIFCLSSFVKYSHQELAHNFDTAILNNKSNKILNILKKLDPSIEEIRTLSIGEPDIYLRRKDETFLPISLFGDCFKRVLDIILQLINAKNSVCLIDEIENGIHYQNQREFWRNLFKLAVELDIQIFATTHSLEMIQAFADVSLQSYREQSAYVGLQSYREQSAYFELARNQKTNEIVSIKRDLELLQYSLKQEKGVGLRGE